MSHFFFHFFIDTEATVMTKALSNTDVFIKAVENWYFSLISRRKAQIPPPPIRLGLGTKWLIGKLISSHSGAEVFQRDVQLVGGRGAERAYS